jgi:hypothetical protein
MTAVARPNPDPAPVITATLPFSLPDISDFLPTVIAACQAVYPPSTGRDTPVMNDASSLARKTTAAAISDPVAARR